MYTGERILLLDILNVLKTHTDEQKRLTQSEIIHSLEKEYGYENLHSKRRTVKSNIERLIRYSENENQNEILYETTVRNTKCRETGEMEEIEVQSDFGYLHEFTNGELRLIIDSVLFSKQIPKIQRDELINKLLKLTSIHFKSHLKHIEVLSSPKLTNYNMFYNIEVIDEAIEQGKQVSFQYNNYQVDEQSKLVLQPTLSSNGQVRNYIINPYQMVTANGRYYLICNYDYFDNLSHYRLDRITNIKILNKKCKPMKEVSGLEHGLNLSEHMNEHIYMFTGKSVFVRLRFKKYVMNEFIDWFGTESVQFSDQTEDKITASVKVNKKAMRKWALQYALYVKVISPQSLVDEIKEDIKQAMKNYE